METQNSTEKQKRNSKRYMSIQRKIFILAGTILITLSFILTLVNVHYIRSSTRNALQLSMQETSQVAADRTKDFLRNKITLAKSISSTIGSQYAAEITKPYQEVNLAAMEKVMDDLSERYDFDYMYIVDNDGFSRNSAHADIAKADLNYYKQIANEGKEEFVSDVYKDTNKLNAYVVNFAVPIRDSSQKKIGVLICKSKADNLSKLMADTSVGKNGRTFIMDNQGVCIAHKNKDMRYNGELFAKVRKNPKYASLNAMFDVVRNNDQGYTEYDYDGNRLCAYQTIAGTKNWTLGVTALESDFMGESNRAVTVSAILALILLLLSGVVVYYIIHPIADRIMTITSRIERLSQGDLTDDVQLDTSNDEVTRLNVAIRNLLKELHTIIDSFNKALGSMAAGNLDVKLVGSYPGDFQQLKESTEQSITKLSDVVNHLSQTAAEVSRGSAQIADGSTSLAQGASEQASSVEELHNTVSELTQHAKEIADQDTKYLEEGSEDKSPQAAEKRLEKAPTLADKLMVAMGSIEQRLTEVRRISGVIERVSSESGMLALNAAVEATHAGEYGKGFSVIAGEIRELSEQCKLEAKTTDEQIDYILQSVERGNKVVGFTVNSVRNITSSLADLETTLSQISSVIEGTAATAEEFAASSQELSAQAEVLKELSSGFTVSQAGAPEAKTQPAQK